MCCSLLQQDAYEEFKRILEKFTLQDEAAAADGEAGGQDEDEAAAAAAQAKPTTSDADSDDNEGKQLHNEQVRVTWQLDIAFWHRGFLCARNSHAGQSSWEWSSAFG